VVGHLLHRAQWRLAVDLHHNPGNWPMKHQWHVGLQSSRARTSTTRCFK
jgi:hypothetical protein